jgi:hypothetical protein
MSSLRATKEPVEGKLRNECNDSTTNSSLVLLFNNILNDGGGSPPNLASGNNVGTDALYS